MNHLSPKSLRQEQSGQQQNQQEQQRSVGQVGKRRGYGSVQRHGLWFGMLSMVLVLLTFPVHVLGAADDLNNHPVERQNCCLCNNCRPPLQDRFDRLVNSDADTCRDMWVRMSSEDMRNQMMGNSDVTRCEYHQMLYHRPCCDEEYLNESLFEEPERVHVEWWNDTALANEYGTGDEPPCDLCHDGGPPDNRTTAVFAILGIPGNNNCQALYFMGKRGMIRDQLCKPLQDEVDVLCGCGHKSGERPAKKAPKQEDPADELGVLPPKQDPGAILDDEDWPMPCIGWNCEDRGRGRGGIARHLRTRKSSSMTA